MRVHTRKATTSILTTIDERDLVSEARRHDPDRYLTAIFAPPACRPLVLGLILFNHELARVPEIASEPVIGMIRYQWWRDALAEAQAGEVRRHPVVEVLATAIREERLAVADLEALIAAREVELDRLQPQRLEDLEAFVAATSGRLSMLVDQVLTGGQGAAPARFAGTAYGLIGILRAVDVHARQNRVLIPKDSSVTAIKARAALLLAQMRPMTAATPRRAGAALLLATVARRQLAALDDEGGDPARYRGLLPLEMLVRGWLRRY